MVYHIYIYICIYIHHYPSTLLEQTSATSLIILIQFFAQIIRRKSVEVAFFQGKRANIWRSAALWHHHIQDHSGLNHRFLSAYPKFHGTSWYSTPKKMELCFQNGIEYVFFIISRFPTVFYFFGGLAIYI